ncbi:Bifunctional NAD(P)H-hydrate repair enzyme Nnr [Austwickia sp. TVS 96-490-7B]|uniref:bifunctional ADP-dependent NAD(P)H-hydrate dehydratase/NAD(P)H-hydrate epimerase n=1 Tax=Austwickia sp. TVS 96-490-7B TaxID=2830843 RepID=UPI001C593B75|nr:ADP/ATP-dependent (S)-NAD(P)H-hydrate dehydratase [Austwickia sp. TVS 96-490-7B]MBW3085652.1 Bifunctional NAD(P)H-hydrate repair enzyme Nnr [Austwickia sp. TVS 96-490-7B]
MVLQAWSVAQVRAAEAAAMAQLPDGELMRRASKGLAKVVRARLAERPDGARVVGLVGSGGNGGDTLYALARIAKTDAAAGVAAILVSSAGAHPEALAAAERRGVQIIRLTDNGRDAAALVTDADILLDGLTGLGGRPGWSPETAAEMTALWHAVPDDTYVIAVDLPSGADPAGRDTDSDGIWADETVTFGAAKPVHVLATSPRCGLLTIVDIGLALDGPPAAERLDLDDLTQLWPVPGPTDDKYTRGVLGIVAGSRRYPGAAVLTVTAALEAGVGMVRYLGPPTPTTLVHHAAPEAVPAHNVSTAHVHAWAIGPGMSVDDERTKEGAAHLAAARAALDSTLPCVVDAGGLDLLDGPRPGAGARTLLTPHAGELARLLTRLTDTTVNVSDIHADPIEHASHAADLLHATVLLKGATTYVVPPPHSGLPIRAQSDGTAWLATAGSGDVLTGLAGTLLAAGLDPRDAGSLAALVHGQAGTFANPDGPIRASKVAQAIGPCVSAALRRR